MKIKILVMSPWAKDSNSQYRCMGPLNYLSKNSRWEFELTLVGEDLGHKGAAWDTVERHDMVFMHRPCRNDDLTILKIAKNLGVPVVVDYDDWLFDLPVCNPTYPTYMDPGVQTLVAMHLACADAVTCSTQALLEKFKVVNPNVFLLPNMYRSDLYGRYREPTLRPRNAQFPLLWRGTATHDLDLMSVGEAFAKLPANITFMGGPYWGALKGMREGTFERVGPTDPFLYMKNLYDRAPTVLLFPLEDCFFNRCKSNIAWQEALHAGALCVAPNMPEWRHPGVFGYEAGNWKDFLKAVEEALMLTPAERTTHVEAAWKHMLELYDAPVVNRTRAKLYEDIIDKRIERNPRDPWDQLVGLWALGRLKGQNLVPHGTPLDTLKAKGIE